MNELSKKRALTLREIDRLIAEKIFGIRPCKEWKKVSLGSAGGPALMHESGKLKHDYECYPDIEEVPAVGGSIGGPARYTTDITTAWRLVDKMHERGLGVVIARRAEDPAYKVELSPTKSASADAGRSAMAIERTAPLAICLVALKMHGIDIAL